MPRSALVARASSNFMLRYLHVTRIALVVVSTLHAATSPEAQSAFKASAASPSWYKHEQRFG